MKKRMKRCVAAILTLVLLSGSMPMADRNIIVTKAATIEDAAEEEKGTKVTQEEGNIEVTTEVAEKNNEENSKNDASEIIDSGTCGENLMWVLTNDGTLSISGEGEMERFESSTNVPWYNSKDNIISVVINDGITTINHFAFSQCENMTNISIPNSVTSVLT